MKYQKITKDMTIAKAMQDYPEIIGIMQDNLGFCASCPGASMESIEVGAKIHEKDVDSLISKLNSAIDKKSNKEKK
jgi:hybrid cluster-associated redox disulfide protein